MSFEDLRKDVIDTDLCASCGACAAVCPADLLRVSVDSPIASLRPDVLPDAPEVISACAECTLCVDVCPGRDTGVTASEQRIFGRIRTEAERWSGISRRTFHAHSTSSDVLEAASAGGAVTSLLITALRSGRADAALVVGRDDEHPWRTAPRLVTSVDELLESAQASYSITPNLQLLRDAPYERVAVVGLACQIQALNRMANLEHRPAVLDKVALTIEIACSSNTRTEGTRHLIEDRLQLPITDVTRLKYRSGPYPGKFTVTDQKNTEHTLPFHEIVTAFKDFKTFRCQSCPDWWSGIADISIADGDPNIFKTSRNEIPMPKQSLVLTRTPVGDTLVDASVRRGEIAVVEAEFTPDDNLGLQRKRNRYLKYQRRFPGRIPNSALAAPEDTQPLDDNEVIERMSPSEGNHA